MRSVLLSILLIAGLSTPVDGQQLKEITNSIGMKLVLIHAGSFTMGSPVGERNRNVDETPHEVMITKSYYLGVYEVTQGEYEKVIGNNPSCFSKERLEKRDSSMYPVETITWDEAAAFCMKLSEIEEERKAERKYRLPTEAEWEYACRATSGASFCFGDSEDLLSEYSWFGEGVTGTTHPVGGKKPSRWGLYDMHGNVMEWCQDRYAYYQTKMATDPQGRLGLSRVSRGGGWSFYAETCRSAARGPTSPDPAYRGNVYGFRVAMSLPAKLPEAASSK